MWGHDFMLDVTQIRWRALMKQLSVTTCLLTIVCCSPLLAAQESIAGASGSTILRINYYDDHSLQPEARISTDDAQKILAVSMAVLNGVDSCGGELDRPASLNLMSAASIGTFSTGDGIVCD